MTTTMRFTDADRDHNGFIRLSPPTENAAPITSPPPPLPARNVPTPTPRVTVPQRMIVLASGGVIGLALIVLTIAFGARPGRIVPRMTAVPSAAAATQALPSPVSRLPSPVAMLPAFAAPDGAQLGMIEATRAITPTAHYGDDWIQADVAGSGVIWLRAVDWPALTIIGPDLAPRPTATARPYVPPPPTPTSEPQPPCLTAGTGAQIVTVCDWLDPEALNAAAAAKWVATYGGNIGTVITPSPQEWNRP